MYREWHIARLAAALLAVGLTAAHAGGLSKSQVSAGAKWIAHYDMERFAATQLCASLLKDPVRGKAFREQLAHYRLFLGVEPLQDIRHITLYGEDVSGSRGTALIAGALDPNLFVKRISANPQYKAVSSGKRTIHQWLDKRSGAPLFACFHAPRLLVVTSDEASMTGALSVLDGRRKALADTRDGLPIPSTRTDVFFMAVSRGYAGSNDSPLRAMILRNTETATVVLAENRNMAEGALRLGASSPEGATLIEQTLNGLMAVSLFGNDDQLGEIARRCAISRNDRLVDVTLRCPATEAAILISAFLSR
jgi:hypothetical protein